MRPDRVVIWTEEKEPVRNQQIIKEGAESLKKSHMIESANFMVL